MKKTERRELPRALIDAIVAEELFQGIQSARSIDICELGMRYEKPLDGLRHDHHEVFLHFNLPGEDDEPIRVLGHVANETRCRQRHTTSVTFAFMKAEDQERVRRYVSKAA